VRWLAGRGGARDALSCIRRRWSLGAQPAIAGEPDPQGQEARPAGAGELKSEPGSTTRAGARGRQVDALQPEDEPPFALGALGGGEARLAVDANLFRAPAAPHAPGGRDFLAVRSPEGGLALRELTGALAVGQQEPNVRVPLPGSRDARCAPLPPLRRRGRCGAGTPRVLRPCTPASTRECETSSSGGCRRVALCKRLSASGCSRGELCGRVRGCASRHAPCQRRGRGSGRVAWPAPRAPAAPGTQPAHCPSQRGPRGVGVAGPPGLTRERCARELSDRRMAAFVARELRRREARAAKGRGGPPALRLAELAEQFPGLSEGAVRGRLKERLPDVEVGARGGEGAEVLIGLRPGGRLPVEGELRRLVTPDQWCGHEAMRAGLLRLAASGVAAHERLAALPPERLRAAAEQLLPAPVRRRPPPSPRCAFSAGLCLGRGPALAAARARPAQCAARMCAPHMGTHVRRAHMCTRRTHVGGVPLCAPHTGRPHAAAGRPPRAPRPRCRAARGMRRGRRAGRAARSGGGRTGGGRHALGADRQLHRRAARGPRPPGADRRRRPHRPRHRLLAAARRAQGAPNPTLP